MELPVIKNISELATTPLRRDALAILEAGYEATLTDRVISSSVILAENDLTISGQSCDLTTIERIFVVAIGKCAADAAIALEAILGQRITDGIVLDVRSAPVAFMRSYVGTHPFPSDANIAATKEIVTLLDGLTPRDLLLVVVSGGGSALLNLPYESDPQGQTAVVQGLWKSGATIVEVNTVRKHMSLVAGGQLAARAHGAHVITLLFSDVPGDDIAVIASGPTVLDDTTIDDARGVLSRHGIEAALGRSVPLTETPKDPALFQNVENILLVTNAVALAAMEEKARVLGYDVQIGSTRLEGIARDIGGHLAEVSLSERSCVLYAGETTVKITGDGKGGRNQELALGALSTVPDGRLVLAAASDGWDNTDKAGAIADASLRRRAEEQALVAREYLDRNDAYHFFEAAGGHIETGKTGINVADFILVLTGSDRS